MLPPLLHHMIHKDALGDVTEHPKAVPRIDHQFVVHPEWQITYRVKLNTTRPLRSSCRKVWNLGGLTRTKHKRHVLFFSLCDTFLFHSQANGAWRTAVYVHIDGSSMTDMIRSIGKVASIPAVPVPHVRWSKLIIRSGDSWQSKIWSIWWVLRLGSFGLVEVGN